MEGGRGEDGEQIVPQPEIAEAAAEGGEEQDAGSVSTVEQIPRHVAASEASTSAHTTTPARSEGRESDVAMAVKMVKAVEQDAAAVAGSLATLFSSLQSALSEVTGSSIEHMRCHSEAAGLLQDASIDAAAKGQRFINACLRLNEEMKAMGSLAAQLKTLRQVVDQFEYHASRSLPRL
jgi:hypothetical protein